MDGFKYAIPFTFKWEGGYSDDRDDPGGKTKFGITERTLKYAKLLGIVRTESVEELTEEEAERIYKELYWKGIRGDEVPLWVGVLLFDTAVNQGVGWAVKHLQNALNGVHVHSKTAPFYSLVVDGIFGPKTMSALRDFALRARAEDKNLFIRLYCVHRDIRYLELIMKNPRLKKFIKGWFLRTSELQDYAQTFVEG